MKAIPLKYDELNELRIAMVKDCREIINKYKGHYDCMNYKNADYILSEINKLNEEKYFNYEEVGYDLNITKRWVNIIVYNDFYLKSCDYILSDPIKYFKFLETKTVYDSILKRRQ